MTDSAENANIKFLCEYEFDGILWAAEVYASTYEEAEMKLRAMGRGKVVGRCVATVIAGGKCPECGREV